MSLLKDTEVYLSNILDSLGYSCEVSLISSSVPELGQFQINVAMALAKKYHKNPKDIAYEIVSKLDDRFVNVNIAGPGFINLSFSDDVIIKYMNECIDNFNIHVDKGDSKTIVIDYGGANAAKALHVGHMRSANIGEALKRISKLYGNKVIGDVHLGDLGRQAGMLISEYKLMYPDALFFDSSYDGEYDKINLTSRDLGDMYAKASISAGLDEDRLMEVREITREVEDGRRGYLELWRQMVEISKKDIKDVYDRLNCSFDVWYGEMDTIKVIPYVLEILRPYLYESEGAMVMDIREEDDKKEYPPLMVIKSDGSSKYETRDLATMYMRMKEFNPDAIWYVIDNRQEFNFLQVFRGAYKSGLVPRDCELEFLGFGTINGTDGRPFKTRDGSVMPLGDLILLIKKEITKKVKDDLPDRDNIIENLTICTLKFADLFSYRKTDYIFDLSKFSSFEGKTGPYIMYTLVRGKSILRKNDNIDYNISYIDDNIRNIYVKVIELSSYLYKSYINRSPNVLCEYLYDLCNLYNKFYNDINISNEKDLVKKNNYLSLTKLVCNTISNIIDLLGICEVERM